MTRALFTLGVAIAIGLILLAPVIVVEPPSRPAMAPEATADPDRSSIDDLAAWPFSSRP